MICVHWEDGGSEMSRELKGLTFHVEEGRSAGRNADIIWSYTYIILDYIIWSHYYIIWSIIILFDPVCLKNHSSYPDRTVLDKAKDSVTAKFCLCMLDWLLRQKMSGRLILLFMSNDRKGLGIIRHNRSLWSGIVITWAVNDLTKDRWAVSSNNFDYPFDCLNTIFVTKLCCSTCCSTGSTDGWH